MVYQVNQLRVSKGLSPVKSNEVLAVAANDFAIRMGGSNFFSHNDPDNGSNKPWDISIENGALDFTRGLELERLRTWVAQDVIVEGRPEWVFVKVYTHGAPEPNAELLLGQGTAAFHRALLEEYSAKSGWNVHYVSAREMFNVARAAMAGEAGNPDDFRDYVLPPPPAATAR